MIFKRKPNPLYETNAVLIQIYGELNRIRLSTNDPKQAKHIRQFDAENNGYIPFFDNPKMYENYKALKVKK